MIQAEADELIFSPSNTPQDGPRHPESGQWLDLRTRGILSVSAAQDDHESLKGILSDPIWNIIPAYSCRQASVQLCRDRVAVIVCRDKLADGTWRDVLSYIAEVTNPPSVVVTCDAADERLRSEVHELGGFDIVQRPFSAETVASVISAAWYHSLVSEAVAAVR